MGYWQVCEAVRICGRSCNDRGFGMEPQISRGDKRSRTAEGPQGAGEASITAVLQEQTSAICTSLDGEGHSGDRWKKGNWNKWRAASGQLPS